MTLTEFSYYSRRYMPIIVIGFLVFLVFFYTVRVFFLYLEATKPHTLSIDPKLWERWGPITPPKLENSTDVSPSISYTFDTIEGTPVTATSAAQVFYLPKATTKFGFREKVFVMAKTFGFDTSAAQYQLNGTQAQFADGNEKLSIDITNYNFTYEYDLSTDKSLFSNTSMPEEKSVEDKAVSFLSTVGTYPAELAQGNRHISYMIYNKIGNNLISTDRPQDANVAEVDFYRPDVDATPNPIPVTSPKFFNSQNYVIMVFNETGYKVIKAQVKFFEKSDQEYYIYPVRTAQQAYNDLKAGHAFLVSPAANGSQNISIKKMFLAYFDPDVYQEYLEPVYVVLGSDNFVAYIPAIAPDMLHN